jgi:hypothetical protein
MTNNLRNPSSLTAKANIVLSLRSLEQRRLILESASNQVNMKNAMPHRELFFNWFCGSSDQGGLLSDIISTLISLFTLGLINPSATANASANNNNRDRRDLFVDHKQHEGAKDLVAAVLDNVDFLQNPGNYNHLLDPDLKDMVDQIMNHYEWNEEENPDLHGRKLFNLFGNCATPPGPNVPTPATCSLENCPTAKTCSSEDSYTMSDCIDNQCQSKTVFCQKGEVCSNDGQCAMRPQECTSKNCPNVACTGPTTFQIQKGDTETNQCVPDPCLTVEDCSCGEDACGNANTIVSFSCDSNQNKCVPSYVTCASGEKCEGAKCVPCQCSSNSCDGNDFTHYTCENGQCQTTTGSCGPDTCNGNDFTRYTCKNGQCQNWLVWSRYL